MGPRAARTARALLAISPLVVAIAACDPPRASAPPVPAVPGPATPPAIETRPPMMPLGAEPVAPSDVPMPEAVDAVTEPTSQRELRIEVWRSSPFLCRAISTTRLRPCRFEGEGDEVAITFPVADLTCRRVVWDASGDPARLEECRSRWLRVPAAIDLVRRDDTWSGSHAGWRWRDGETYCCPGAWISAPDALREGAPALEPLDADRDTPPPKPPRD